ncbi:MAG: M48 family metalloprotease [Pseudomonadota bacterium]
MPNLLKMLAATIALLIAAAQSANAQGLIRDAEIEKILREWTNPILEAAELEPNDVGLYIINDRSLNAFVANGQRIHLHAGLIMAADNSAQVIGVIAHETCHIACGHTVTRTRAAQVASRPALISIGLGVLAIAAGAGDAGAALIASSQQFAALNFFVHTRAEEAMADSEAIRYLEALGWNTSGISQFFEKYRYQEVLSEARRYPYFRTHPLASQRVRTTRALSQDTGLNDIPLNETRERQFQMMKAKFVGFLEPPARVFNEYPPTDVSEPARYARAISAMRSADHRTALIEVEELIKIDPENPYFHELKGDILMDDFQASEAVIAYEKAREYLPDNSLLKISYARARLAREEPGDLEAAELTLRDALAFEPDNAFAWRELSIAYEKQDKRALAQLATAESRYNIGDYPNAYGFAMRAIRELEPNTPAWRQASDIRNATDPALPENEIFWRRRR